MTSEQQKSVLHCWMDAFNANDRGLLDRLADETLPPGCGCRRSIAQLRRIQ